jgi:rhomboid protease GluP
MFFAGRGRGLIPGGGPSHNGRMTSPPPPPPPAPGPVAPADVLRWCALVAPELWFPSAAATAHGVPREALHEPLRLLRQAELVAVADWVAGRGQGYRLTAAGEKVARAGEAVPPTTDLVDPGPPPLSGLSRNDRELITREAFQNPRAAIVTPALILACLVWFAVGAAVAWRHGRPIIGYLRDGDSQVLLKIGAIYGPDLLRGEWWRLVASGFVHVGALHLLVNMFSLAVLGPVAEGLWGRKRFIVLYFLSGLASACGAALLNPDAVTAGASGSLWGLQSAVIVWLVRFREHLPPALFGEWMRRILFVTAVNVVLSLTPSVSWQSHLAGGLAGFAAGVFLDWARWGSGRRRYTAGTLGLMGMVVGMLGGLWAGSYSLGEWKAIRQRAAPPVARPAALDPVFVDAFDGVQPQRWMAILQAAVDAGRDPAAVAHARERCARLRRHAAELRARLAPEPSNERLRAYAGAVGELADRLDALLATPAPAKADWDEVAERAAKAATLWRDLAAPG